MYCKYCGAQISEDSRFCSKCGANLSEGENSAHSGNSGQSNEEYKKYEKLINQERKEHEEYIRERELNTAHNFAFVSLILGILSLLVAFIGSRSAAAQIIAACCGIVGIYCAVYAKRRGFNGGSRKAGFVLSIIGLGFSVLFFIIQRIIY